MENIDDIKKLYEANSLAEAEQKARQIILSQPGSAEALFMLGRIQWKKGLKAEAISLYTRAADIDPACGAAEALEQARQIMDFYNKDLYNP